MTDTVIHVNGTRYNVIVYACEDTGYWRVEAARGGRVLEVIDVPSEGAALAGMTKVLLRRNGNGNGKG